MTRLSTKLWLLFLVSTALTVVILLAFSKYVYESIYVTDVEQSMEQLSMNWANQSRGDVTPEFIQQVEEYNRFSPVEVFAVQNPRELSACLPFEIDYDALISGQDRQQLLNGEVVVKRGYESRFDREVISLIYPIAENQRLKGIIYTYVPLSPVTDFLKNHFIYFALGAFLLFVIMASLSRLLLQSLLRPLEVLQKATEEFAEGNYGARVTTTKQDEVGQLSFAFNRMAEAVEQQDYRKKEFLAIVSHELRTPLSSLVGYSKALEQGQIEPIHYKEVFHMMVSESERMNKLTQDLMTVAHNEEVEVNLQPLAASDLVEQALQIMKPIFVNKSVTLTQDVDDELIVRADEQHILQVLLNLLDNALTYSPEGSTVNVTLVGKQENAHFTIQDQGPGIADHHIPHLTERFYRVNAARTRNDGGSGLGLTIVDQLLKKSHGQLSIESEINHGTSVTFTLSIWKEDYE